MMKTKSRRAFTTISKVWADAIREDAVRDQNFALEELGIQRVICIPILATLHVGDLPPEKNWATIPAAEREKLFTRRKTYFGRRPRCRSCGERIEDGTKVVAFGWAPNRYAIFGTPSVIHYEPCEGET